MRRRPGGLLVALALAATAAPGPATATAQSRVVILSTTTSTQDSGLLDVLVPLFERETGYALKTVAVGTGQALALAARGEADVVLAHAPDLELKYVADSRLRNRRLVMTNDFVMVGPEADPARIRGVGAVEAMRRIAAAEARFVSRGDQSGTHQLELGLWRQAAIAPRGPWYIEAGQGMGATLTLAHERQAYTLTDRATLLAFRTRVRLPVLLAGDRRLLNIYAVLEASPENGPRVNTAGGRAFADFLVSPAAQAVIRTFGVDRSGQPLFVPAAGKTDTELGG